MLTPVNELSSLNILAYAAIKEAILTFKLLPGQSLVESSLASMLKISKTPVRDALLRLEKEGLVVKVPFKGAVVAELTPKSMVELFQVRSALEGLAIRLSIHHITDEQIAQLDRLMDEYELFANQGKIEEASLSNRTFHALLVNWSDNDLLKQYLSNLEDHMRRYRTLSIYQKGRLGKSIEEHKTIMEAIQRRDAYSAEIAMRNHLLTIMQDLNENDFTELISNINNHVSN